MTNGRKSTNIPIVGFLLQTKPSPIIVGTIVVLAIVILFGGLWSSPSPGGGSSYITFDKLFSGYDKTMGNFPSYNAGDTVTIKDIIISSSYHATDGCTPVYFSTSLGSLYIQVSGNLTSTYPAGTTVCAVIHIISVSGYECIDVNVSSSDIWAA